jgi:hypothetical protein
MLHPQICQFSRVILEAIVGDSLRIRADNLCTATISSTGCELDFSPSGWWIVDSAPSIIVNPRCLSGMLSCDVVSAIRQSLALGRVEVLVSLR